MITSNQPSSSIGFFLLFISFCILSLAVFTAIGEVELPSECIIGKNLFIIFTLLCGSANWLYSTGGYFMASSIWFILGFLILYSSVTMLKPNPSFKRDA